MLSHSYLSTAQQLQMQLQRCTGGALAERMRMTLLITPCMEPACCFYLLTVGGEVQSKAQQRAAQRRERRGGLLGEREKRNAGDARQLSQGEAERREEEEIGRRQNRQAAKREACEGAAPSLHPHSSLPLCCHLSFSLLPSSSCAYGLTSQHSLS